jgi:hypothetical protein
MNAQLTSSSGVMNHSGHLACNIHRSLPFLLPRHLSRLFTLRLCDPALLTHQTASTRQPLQPVWKIHIGRQASSDRRSHRLQEDASRVGQGNIWLERELLGHKQRD